MVAEPNEMKPDLSGKTKPSFERSEPAFDPHMNRFKNDSADDSADYWQSEIARTRAKLDTTVDELEGRLTFDEITSRSMDAMKRGAMKGAGKAADMIKEHPLPAIVIGAGIAWMFMQAKSKSSSPKSAAYGQAFDRRRDPSVVATTYGGGAVGARASGLSLASDSGTSAIGEATSKAASKVGEVASNIGEKVTRGMHDAADGVKSAGSHVKDGIISATSGVGDAASAVGQGVQHAAKKSVHYTDEFIHHYPLAAAGACFALGVMGGLAIPASRLEDDAVGETSDRLKNQAQEKGAELFEQGRDMAERATDQAGEKIKAAVASVSSDSDHNRMNDENDGSEGSGGKAKASSSVHAPTHID